MPKTGKAQRVYEWALKALTALPLWAHVKHQRTRRVQHDTEGILAHTLSVVRTDEHTDSIDERPAKASSTAVTLPIAFQQTHQEL